MSENGIEVRLQGPIVFANDFDAVESGVSFLVTLVFVGSD